MTLLAPRAPCGAPSRTVPFSLLPLLFLGGLLGVAEPGAAQVPTAAQAQQMLQQNPGLGDVLRQRIQQSGLTAEQVRARLQASGYPANLLDAYLGGGAAAAGAQPGTLELAAIQALGLQPVGGAEALPVDTGFIRVRGGSVPRSRVFGVDAFRRTTTQFLPLLSGPVPPDYKLGAGDVLVLILTGDVELAYTLQVTREGFVLIPQVGQMFVSNLTLDQLRDLLYARLGRVYSGVKRGANATTKFDISVANVRANQAYVVGEVSQPGAYQLSSLGTVLTALYAAGGVTERADRGQRELRRAVMDVALRPVRRDQGTVRPGEDPTAGMVIPSLGLQDGDSVVVDSVLALGGQYFVAVAGMVTKPGMYPWREGMTLRDLVLLARGPRVGAYLKEAEIARLPEERSKGQLATTVRVPMDSTYLLDRDSLGRYVGPPGVAVPAAGAPEVPLQPYDNVLILKQPEWDFQRTVVVVGEVRYPGTYSLRTKTDRLADLIERAGGLTRQAYAEGLRFVRVVNDVGRVNIDLHKALGDTTSGSNIILQPGDSIDIPEYQPAVKVGGAVNSPGSVLWKRGAGLDYYLEGAGGFSNRASKGKVSVKYANGEVRTRKRALLFSSDPKPGPGSEVFVPVRDSTEHANYAQLFTSIVQIVASAVTTINVIKHL